MIVSDPSTIIPPLYASRDIEYIRGMFRVAFKIALLYRFKRLTRLIKMKIKIPDKEREGEREREREDS